MEKNQQGYIISFITFIVLIIMLSMAMAMSFLIAEKQKSVTNAVKSTQVYYTAESGIEDALLRLKRNPALSSVEYSLNVNNAITTVNIPSTLGMSKTITSQANNANINRKVRAISGIDNAQNVSFYYGVEVGEGGLIMSNGSRVIGNVFSAGNISGSGVIDNNAVVSGNGHSISGVTVKGDAFAYSCLSGATVEGELTYVEGGQHECSHGNLHKQTQEILAQPLPIPQEAIDDWKIDAEEVQPIIGNLNITKSRDLGPIKITGNLTLSNNVEINLTGVVYVQGNIILGNGNIIRVSNSYSNSGIIIADGLINTGNNASFYGSGQAGSYLLVLSTNTADNAITVKNNSTGAVFYTSAGGLTISNNVSVIEATGYKVILSNNAVIQYSSGIVNIYFASGPGGGWKVTSWQEY